MNNFNHNKNNQKKDDADQFREQSLRAIRRRKMMAKLLSWTLTAIAIAMLAAVVAVYYFDI